jgi:[ribosomal protein S18]-alanine N-acetyltransferase
MSAELLSASQRSDGPAPRVVRESRPEDASAIDAILREANLSSFTASPLNGQPQSAIGELRTMVCELRGQIVGVLQWRHLGEESEILDIAVRAVERRRGHASFLFENFLRLAAASGAHQIFLEVRESNTLAIALYKKFGFAVTGRRPNYYRDPDESALLMKSTLPG